MGKFKKSYILILAFFGLATACGGGDDETTAATPVPAEPAIVSWENAANAGGINVANATFVENGELPEESEGAEDTLEGVRGPEKLIEGRTIPVSLTPATLKAVDANDPYRIIKYVNFEISFADDVPGKKPWTGFFRINVPEHIRVTTIDEPEPILVNFRFQDAFFNWYRRTEGEEALDRIKRRGRVKCIFQLVYVNRNGRTIGYSNQYIIYADFPEEVEEEPEPEPSPGEEFGEIGEIQSCMEGGSDRLYATCQAADREAQAADTGNFTIRYAWREGRSCEDLGFDCEVPGDAFQNPERGAEAIRRCAEEGRIKIWHNFGLGSSNGVCIGSISGGN